MKFGGEFLRYEQNSFYPGNDGELGAFNYTGAYSANPYAANGIALSVRRLPSRSSAGCADWRGDGLTGQRQWRDGIFAQDDFKLNTKLTLNMGVRWEFDQPIYEVNNKMANVNMQTLAD
jgi:outer membrane receptor protein involved in Fe transport